MHPYNMHLDNGLGHGRDDALLNNDPGLGGLLEGLFGHPFGADRQAERSLVLLSGLKGMRQLRGEVFLVLQEKKKE
jgi:hypothetical protein